MVHGWPLLSAALTACELLWGSVCHHVEREASRFIPSSLRPYDIHGAWPKRMKLSSIQTSAIFPGGHPGGTSIMPTAVRWGRTSQQTGVTARKRGESTGEDNHGTWGGVGCAGFSDAAAGDGRPRSGGHDRGYHMSGRRYPGIDLRAGPERHNPRNPPGIPITGEGPAVITCTDLQVGGRVKVGCTDATCTTAAYIEFIPV